MIPEEILSFTDRDLRLSMCNVELSEQFAVYTKVYNPVAEQDFSSVPLSERHYYSQNEDSGAAGTKGNFALHEIYKDGR